MRSSLVWPFDSLSACEQLKVDKVRVPVELLLDGGEHVDGSLFVLPIVEPTSGRELIIDLLRSDKQFLPVTTGGSVRLINKDRIVLICVPDPEDAGLEEAPTGELSQADAVIVLAGVPAGACRLDGRMRWSSPPERSRLLDHMNASEQWLAVEKPAGVALVSARYIVSVDLEHPVPER